MSFIVIGAPPPKKKRESLYDDHNGIWQVLKTLNLSIGVGAQVEVAPAQKQRYSPQKHCLGP